MLGAEPSGDGGGIELKEVVLKARHPWNGQPIRDLDVSRRTEIVMVTRRGKAMVPDGDLVLSEGDRVILYTRLNRKREDPVPS